MSEEGYWVTQGGVRLWVSYPRTGPPPPSIRTQHVLEPEYYEQWRQPTLPKHEEEREEEPSPVARPSSKIAEAKQKIESAKEHLLIAEYRLKDYELVERKETSEGIQYTFAPIPSPTPLQRVSSFFEDVLSYKVPIGKTFGPEAGWEPKGKTVYFYPGRAALVGTAIAAPVVVPETISALGFTVPASLSTPALVQSAAISIGATEAVSLATKRQFATPSELLSSVLLAESIQVGIGVVSPAVSKLVGIAEKQLVPESYYYYKYILGKPMLTTIAKEYAKGTTKALIGEEAYLYVTKIGLPTLTQKVLPQITATVRTSFMESPLGEAYLYGKAVAYPALKYEVLPQIEKSLLQVGAYGKSVFLESPMGEAFLYGKAVTYPTIKFAVTTKYSEMASAVKSAFLESSLGEAYLYTKSVAAPQLLATAKTIPKMLPSLPFDISEAKWYIQSYVSEVKLSIKSYMGKEYILALPKPLSYPMKPLWLPQKTVEFPTKPITISRSYLLLKETPETISKTATPIFSSIASIAIVTAGTYETKLHGWKGTPYPFKFVQPKVVQETETMILHYPTEPLTIHTPKTLMIPTTKLKTTLAISQAETLRTIEKSISRFQIGQFGKITQKQRVGIVAELFQIPRLTEMQITMPLQLERQMQKSMSLQSQTQMLKQLQKQIPKTIQAPKELFEEPFKPKRYRKKAKEPFDLFGRYPRAYPLATPKQVLEMFAVKRRKRR